MARASRTRWCAQDVTPAELTWKAGVDVLSFGVIKNGGMNAEAVVFFDPARVADFEFRRKRAGQLACKGRYAAVQLLTYLESGIWKRNAERANRLAARIAAAAPQLLSEPFATNQVFMKLGDERIAALSARVRLLSLGPRGLGRVPLRVLVGYAGRRCRRAVRRAREAAVKAVPRSNLVIERPRACAEHSIQTAPGTLTAEHEVDGADQAQPRPQEVELQRLLHVEEARTARTPPA